MLTNTLFAALPIARYRFTARLQQPLPLPDYAGSLLRGQFGAALRNVACMTRAPTCSGCPLLQTCPYSRIFETLPPPKGQHTLQNFSQIPKPYIVEPPTPGARLLAAGDALVFHLVLVGHAIDQLALVIFALQRALVQGLTRQRVPADLLQVDHIDRLGVAHPVWHHGHPTLADHTATLQAPAAVTAVATNSIAASACNTWSRGQKDTQHYPADAADAADAAAGAAEPGAGNSTAINTPSHTALVLHITTPLRLQQQGQPLGVGQLTPRALVAAIARRVALLMEFHGGPAAGIAGEAFNWGAAAKTMTHLSEALTDSQDLHWHDWTCYSSRQQQEMTLGGVLGRWTLNAQDAATLAAIHPWLWLGQWLHAGKNATMGMGGYTLETPAP